ncbi:MAG: DUF4440 domain-containing protein [Gemmatimonadaceae bacterium]
MRGIYLARFVKASEIQDEVLSLTSDKQMFELRNRSFGRTAILLCVLLVACNGGDRVPVEQRRTISDSLQKLVVQAYDFSKPDASRRLLSLYPDSGRVISASGGHVSTTRTALESGITGFWQRVGQNMQGPKFVLGSAYVDVLTRNSAVMTMTYSIPHLTPAGMPHTVSGAWTMLWRRQDGRWVIVQEHLSDTPESTMSSDSLAAATMDPKMSMPMGGKK